mgnify:CR=1 FL=1
MGIRFEDRSDIASIIRGELENTALNVVRSYRAGVEEKENKQSREELSIASNNIDHITRKISSLKPGVSTQSDVDNIYNGIQTLKQSHPDNKVFQSSVNLLELELTSASDRLDNRNTTVNKLDDLLTLTEKKIKDPYQKTFVPFINAGTGINALMDDIKTSYDNEYNNLTIQDQKFYGDKVNEALDYLAVAQKMSQMDIDETTPGLQLNEELTKLGFIDGQLTNPDAFQSNNYQSTMKGAAKFFQEGDYTSANELFKEAAVLEITESAKARDINAVFDLYYDEEGKVKDKWAKETEFLDVRTGERVQMPMTDLLNTALSYAKQGQLDESQRYLNMIPKDLQAMKEQEKEMQGQWIEDQYTEFDSKTMGYVNQADQVQFDSKALNDLIIPLGLEKEQTAIATGFNQIKNIELLRTKSGQVTKEQVDNVRSSASEAIVTVVLGMDKGNLSEKLQTLVSGYNNTALGSSARKLAANKIALHLYNTPKDVETFDLGGIGNIRHKEGLLVDRALRQEIQKMFTKYGYISDLFNNLQERSTFEESLKQLDGE